LETALGAHVEVARLPSFAKVAALARKADEFLGSVIARRVPAGQSGHAEGPATASGSGRAATAWTGGIKSREDVSRAIDAICGYYEEHEPSSPIPIFMARCKRLVMMGFVDIVRELLPDALSQVDVLRGHVENQ
jgi:type VI secretion system protein ImpA